LTQAEAADSLGMSRTTIVAIEKGERKVASHEIIQFAKLYRRSISELLSRKVVAESFVPLFRAARKEIDASLDRAANELQMFAENYVELERLLDAPLARRFPPEYDTRGGIADCIAEEVAAAERNRLGMGDGPVGNLRARLENDIGLRIFYFPMESRIAGLFAYNDLLGACVGVNSKHPRDRRNWTLAHEYGHFLMTRYQIEVTILTTDTKMGAKERLADGLAKCFLMPATGLNRRFTEIHRAAPNGITLADVFNLANLYQVSVQALVLRLEDLSRLPAGTWQKLTIEGLKAQKVHRLPDIDANPVLQELLPTRYVSLAVEAYRKGHLSEGQLARFLRTDRVTARLQIEQMESEIHLERGGSFFPVSPDFAQPLGGR